MMFFEIIKILSFGVLAMIAVALVIALTNLANKTSKKSSLKMQKNDDNENAFDEFWENNQKHFHDPSYSFLGQNTFHNDQHLVNP